MRETISIVLLSAFSLAVGCAAPVGSAERVGVVASADTVDGSICASPRNGGEYCTPSNGNVLTVWSQAKAAGGEPIQLWAQWTSGLTLAQFVSDPTRLNAWLADVDKVLIFVRSQGAESYKATMGGKLASLLKQVQDEQARQLAQTQNDPIGEFKTALLDKANAEGEPIRAEIASDKASIARVHAVFARARSAIAPLQTEYAAIVTRFRTYRGTESVELERFSTLAQQASSSTLETLATAETAIFNASREASTSPNDLLLDAMRASAHLQQIERQYRAGLEPLMPFIRTHGTSVPDMTSSALRSLAAMQAYVEQRRARNDAAVYSLIDGIEVRRQALIMLSASEATRATLAQTRLLAASTTFNNEATARISDLWKAPPTSTVLKLPYLSDRYDRFTTFLQLEPMCDPTSSSWRETGCIALRRHFNTARTYQSTTLRMLITMGIATMRNKGVDPTLLDAVQAKLTSGDVKSAAVAYDAAVRSSEGA